MWMGSGEVVDVPVEHQTPPAPIFLGAGVNDGDGDGTRDLAAVTVSGRRVANVWREPLSEIHSGDQNTPSALDNSWTEPEASSFLVRGKAYLTKGKAGFKIKQPSAPPLFSPIGCHNYMRGGGSVELPHVSMEAPSLAAHVAAHPDQFFLFVCWMLPGPPFRTVLFAFQRTLPVGADPVADALLAGFVGGTDAQRATRFKYLPRLDVVPPMVLGAVRTIGGERPTLLCNKLTPRYFRGPNYMEIDIDIASSRIANMVAGLILPKITDVVVSHAFLLEGHCEDELPERALACIRTQGVRMVENTVVL